MASLQSAAAALAVSAVVVISDVTYCLRQRDRLSDTKLLISLAKQPWQRVLIMFEVPSGCASGWWVQGGCQVHPLCCGNGVLS
jgi:hypothetical protein